MCWCRLRPKGAANREFCTWVEAGAVRAQQCLKLLWSLFRCQVRNDTSESGLNKSTEDSITRGGMLVQALVHEIGGGDYQQWLQAHVTQRDGGEGAIAVATVIFDHLLKKIQNKEQWTNLPKDANGKLLGSLTGVRDICPNHHKLIKMALANDISAARNVVVPQKFFDSLPNCGKCLKLLQKHSADQSVQSGTEASMRRDKSLSSEEQLALFESILSNQYAQQRFKGDGQPPRSAIDTLTLGVILSLHYGIGQRCVNVRYNPRVSPSLPLSFITRTPLLLSAR